MSSRPVPAAGPDEVAPPACTPHMHLLNTRRLRFTRFALVEGVMYAILPMLLSGQDRQSTKGACILQQQLVLVLDRWQKHTRCTVMPLT